MSARLPLLAARLGRAGTGASAPSAVALCGLALLLGLGGFGIRPAVAGPRLDPFRSAAGRAPQSFDPVRVSQAEPAPATPAAPATAPAPAQSPTQAAAAVGQACRDDNQCPAGTICERNVCRPVEPPIHALLFRKEGGSTAFIPFYFHRRGNPGYRVIAPFYWHFWSPQSRSRIVAPFYWRFEDHVARRVVLVIPPYSQTTQPDARSWAVWPIFYASTKFGWAAPLLLSFKIGDPEQGRAYGLYALLYFWKRNERAGTSFDLVFPLLASSRGPRAAFTWVLPLNFYWRNQEGKNLLALPLFYWNRRDNGGTLVSPLGYYSHDGRNKRGSALWLYWFGRTHTTGAQSAHDVVFPVFWSFRSPLRNTTVLPPLVHLRRPTWSLTTVFPIYWAGRDWQRGSGWKLLAPLYLSRTGEGGRTFSWLTPIGGYRRDSDLATRTLFLLVPPFVHRRDPQRELDLLLPIFLRQRDPRDGSSTTWAVLFYRRLDPAGSTTTLFPLFWHFRSEPGAARAQTLLPFYFWRRSADESLTAAGLFPVMAYYRRFKQPGENTGQQAGQDLGYSAGLFPVAFFGRTPERGHGVLFPLFWHFRGPQTTTTVAAPFFLRFSDQQGTTAAIPPLLYFYGRDGAGDREERSHVQFPFFWRFSSQRTGLTTTVIPPFYWRSGDGRRASGWSAGLFPLVFGGSWQDRSHFVLFPLFWRFSDRSADRHTTVVANYLHRRHGGETTDALFPLLHFRRGARPGAQPETSFTLFPLVHYKRTSDRRYLITPLAFSARTPTTKAGVIPPYVWYEGSKVSASGVPPLYFDVSNKESGERTRLFGPWVAIDSPTARARVLFPLFARYSDEKEWGTWVFPFYFRRRTHAGYALDTVFPLLWLSRWPGHRSTVVGPWYGRWGPERRSTGFVPLYFYARNPDRQYLVTPLFYQRQDYKAGTGKLFAALLFWRSTHREGHTTVVFPLYWSRRSGARSWNVLFPLSWHFRNSGEGGDGGEGNASSVNLTGPFYWSSHQSGNQRTRGILPVAWYSRDDKLQTKSHALLPLFYEKHGPAQLTLLTLPFGFHRQPDRHWWYALTVFHRDSVQSRFTMVAPLWFSHHNKGSDTRTRVFPPLLHFSRSRPDRALSGWLLLFWRHRDIASSTTLALPFFYDVHNFHQNRLTLLAPLYFRYWRGSDNTAYHLAPLFYRRSSPDSSTTVAFPLLWDFKGSDRRTTVFAPFYVGIRRPTYLARFIFPSIYYRKGLGTQAGTSRLFIFPLWESSVKRPGDYMWEALLGLFGYERIGRNRYLKVLFIPFELEPSPAAQAAWYGKGPPRPRRERRYGLDTRSW